MDDTRIRFLNSIAAQLDVDRIAEAHLFPAIRQGGMESGVAVLALDLARQGDVAAEETEADAPSAEIVADEAQSPPDAESVTEEPEAAMPSEDVVVETESVSDDSPYAEADLADESEVAEESSDVDETELEEPPTRPRPRRFTVYTARYRHTLKGPDRGKWEVSVTEEADAPLMTVDAVVRGVQRRSGDVDEIVRLTGDEIVALTTARTTAA